MEQRTCPYRSASGRRFRLQGWAGCCSPILNIKKSMKMNLSKKSISRVAAIATVCVLGAKAQEFSVK